MRRGALAFPVNADGRGQGLSLGPGLLSALYLLPRERRWKLAILVAVSALVGLLDLLGIALIGVLVYGLISLTPTSSPQGSTPFGFVEAWVPEAGSRGFIALAALACGFLLLKSALASYLTWRTLGFLGRTQSVVATAMAEGLFSFPLWRIQTRSSQQLVWALLTGVQSATVLLLGPAALAVVEVSLLAILTIALMAFSPWTTLAAMLFFGVVAVFMHYALSGWAGRLGRLQADSNTAFTECLQDGVKTYRELKVMGRLPQLVRRLGEFATDSGRAAAERTFLLALPKYIYESALVIGGLALAAIQFSANEVSEAAAVVAVFLVAGTRIMPSMLRLQGFIIVMRDSLSQAEATFALFSEIESYGSEPRATPVHLEAEVFRPVLQLKNVTARYPECEAPVLAHISIDIHEGQMVAIVGPSGSGKSSLLDVILGILPVESGSVTISGRIVDSSLGMSFGDISYVPQSISLVSGTLAENIDLYGEAGSFNESRALALMRGVGLAGDLNEREGLQTQVGELGARLSGGQGQRLGLVRALYGEPSLILLDEATSQLDAKTEALIADTLASLQGRVTQIMVAHRLSTVRDADLVIYLDAGRIVASGTFEAVRQEVPAFDESARLLGL